MIQRTTGRLAEAETIKLYPHVIDRLIQEIALKVSDNDFHNKTPSEIEKILGRKLKRAEKKAWIEHRQKFIRNKKRQIQITENEQRRSDALRKKKLLTFRLVGHTNTKLCEIIIALEIAHTQKVQDEDGTWREKKGRDSTPQLIRALALHTSQEIRKLILQIDTFTPQQKKTADTAIRTIVKYYEGIKTLERSKSLLTQLSDADLIDEIVSVFAACAQGDNFLQWFFRPSLEALGDSQTVELIQKRIANLELSDAFTEEMRQKVVNYIIEYLATLPKKQEG